MLLFSVDIARFAGLSCFRGLLLAFTCNYVSLTGLPFVQNRFGSIADSLDCRKQSYKDAFFCCVGCDIKKLKAGGTTD